MIFPLYRSNIYYVSYIKVDTDYLPHHTPFSYMSEIPNVHRIQQPVDSVHWPLLPEFRIFRCHIALAFFRCKKEHFQTGILRSHKSNWCPGFILSYDQMFHSLWTRRHSSNKRSQRICPAYLCAQSAISQVCRIPTPLYIKCLYLSCGFWRADFPNTVAIALL